MACRRALFGLAAAVVAPVHAHVPVRPIGRRAPEVAELKTHALEVHAVFCLVDYFVFNLSCVFLKHPYSSLKFGDLRVELVHLDLGLEDVIVALSLADVGVDNAIEVLLVLHLLLPPLHQSLQLVIQLSRQPTQHREN